MSKIRSEDTKPERELRSALWRAGKRFRKHDRRLPGKPDISFPKAKLAVFVDGDFWHGREWAERGRLPETNGGFWRAKFERNMARDRETDAALLAMGWLPLRVWESEIRRDRQAAAASVIEAIRQRIADMGLEPRLVEDV